MDSGIALVLAAAVTGSFGLLTVFIQKLKKENHADHQVVQGILRTMHRSINRAEDKLDKVSERLTDHIEHHQK